MKQYGRPLFQIRNTPGGFSAPPTLLAFLAFGLSRSTLGMLLYYIALRKEGSLMLLLHSPSVYQKQGGRKGKRGSCELFLFPFSSFPLLLLLLSLLLASSLKGGLRKQFQLLFLVLFLSFILSSSSSPLMNGSKWREGEQAAEEERKTCVPFGLERYQVTRSGPCPPSFPNALCDPCVRV